VSVVPGTLTVITTSTDVLPVRSAAAAGGLAELGLAGWLGTMSPHTGRAYEGGDLRQFTAWLAGRGIDPVAVTPGVTTAWLAALAAGGQAVSTRRRKLAAVLSFYRYAAAEGVTVTAPSAGHDRSMPISGTTYARTTTEHQSPLTRRLQQLDLVDRLGDAVP